MLDFVSGIIRYVILQPIAALIQESTGYPAIQHFWCYRHLPSIRNGSRCASQIVFTKLSLLTHCVVLCYRNRLYALPVQHALRLFDGCSIEPRASGCHRRLAKDRPILGLEVQQLWTRSVPVSYPSTFLKDIMRLTLTDLYRL